MTIIERAVHALRDAEQVLRGLAAEALQNAQYTVVGQLAELANGLASLLPVEAAETPGPTLSQPEPTLTKDSLAANTARKRGKAPYPQFRRDGSSLMKIGWSKTGHCEYEQRAPEAVLHALVARAIEAARGGATFTLEELLPLLSHGGQDVPTYQAYLALGWLRGEGLLSQHGRRGYSLPNAVALVANVRARWQRIPEVTRGKPTSN